MKHTITLAKKSTAYWTYHESTKPVIIMIHGFRGTHHGLQRIVDELSQFHIIVPDLPGFGESEPLTSHDLESYVSWLHEFIKSLNLSEPPVLLGHSFGSIITSHYATEYPDTITRLILVNPIGAPALKGPRGVMTRLAILYYWLGRALPEKASHAWLSTPLIVKIMSVTMAKSRDKTMLRYIHDQHLQHFSTFANPTVVAEAFTTSVSHDVREVASHIKIPTLLIAGEKDDITALPKQHELHDALPSSELVVIPGVGHLIHYETAREAAQAIETFIAR